MLSGRITHLSVFLESLAELRIEKSERQSVQLRYQIVDNTLDQTLTLLRARAEPVGDKTSDIAALHMFLGEEMG